ncbi:MAG: ABC transporter [Oscillospiraceae bacterium]|nr:ABC transporter [Oscillospiraceae bacterium]
MRFLSALTNDMRYQFKYGFYFLYSFISAIYVAALLICPAEYKKTAASIIILTDPAMLGTFFIGGIWLLEKNEGLHGFWGISPLRPMEYIISKAMSLSIVSTIASGLIILFGLREKMNYPALLASVFAGSMVFTVIGLIIATYARSVNHYILIASLPAVFLTIPPILAAFGISYPFLDILPGTALWRMIAYSMDISNTPLFGLWFFLIFWLGVALCYANRRIPLAMQVEGGEKI